MVPASSTGPDASSVIEHASCVAHNGRGVLIRGASGAGKSSLALTLMAFGARLVADDRVCLSVGSAGVMASSPAPLLGLIEARGVGLLQAEPMPKARVVCVVDLDVAESHRLPPRRTTLLVGQSVTLLNRVDGPHFAPAVIQFLSAGRHE